MDYVLHRCLFSICHSGFYDATLSIYPTWLNTNPLKLGYQNKRCKIQKKKNQKEKKSKQKQEVCNGSGQEKGLTPCALHLWIATFFVG